MGRTFVLSGKAYSVNSPSGEASQVLDQEDQSPWSMQAQDGSQSEIQSQTPKKLIGNLEEHEEEQEEPVIVSRNFPSRKDFQSKPGQASPMSVLNGLHEVSGISGGIGWMRATEERKSPMANKSLAPLLTRTFKNLEEDEEEQEEPVSVSRKDFQSKPGQASPMSVLNGLHEVSGISGGIGWMRATEERKSPMHTAKMANRAKMHTAPRAFKELLGKTGADETGNKTRELQRTFSNASDVTNTSLGSILDGAKPRPAKVNITGFTDDLTRRVFEGSLDSLALECNACIEENVAVPVKRKCDDEAEAAEKHQKKQKMMADKSGCCKDAA